VCGVAQREGGRLPSFAEAVLGCHASLYRYARSLCGEQHEAEELLQETYKRALAAKRKPTAVNADELRPWMFRILRNAFLASVSGKLRLVEDVDGKFTGRLAHAPDQEWRIRFRELLDALAKLPPQNCEALLLVAGSGLTYEEAAEVCDCSVGTVKSRVSRARDRLTEIVGADLAEPAPEVGRSQRIRLAS